MNELSPLDILFFLNWYCLKYDMNFVSDCSCKPIATKTLIFLEHLKTYICVVFERCKRLSFLLPLQTWVIFE